MDQASGDALEVDIQNKRFALKGEHVGLIFAFITAVGVGILCWVMWQHQQDGRDNGQAFVTAIKEQTKAVQDSNRATRELLCNIRLQNQANAADICRGISQ